MVFIIVNADLPRTQSFVMPVLDDVKQLLEIATKAQRYCIVCCRLVVIPWQPLYVAHINSSFNFYR